MPFTHLAPILNVRDVAASVAWFESWGWTRAWMWYDQVGRMDTDPEFEKLKRAKEVGTPSFASVCARPLHSDQNSAVFLCRNGQGGREAEGPMPGAPGAPQRDYEAHSKGVWMSVFVSNVDEIHATCVRLGYEVLMPPKNEPWGVREFHLRHPDGHVFRVSGPTTA